MLDNIRLAFSSLWANKLRALLTMLGIIIGIGSVIAIVTVGDSLTGSITDSMQSIGAANITVSLQQKSSDSQTGGRTLLFGRTSPDEEDLISDEMVEEYRRLYADKVAAVAIGESLGSSTVSIQDTSVQVSVLGANADYSLLDDLNLTAGRFVKDTDGQRQIAVVSDLFAETLFPGQRDVIGQEFSLSINGVSSRFYIVGVYEYQQSGQAASLDGSDPVTTLYIPLQTAKKLSDGQQGYQSLTVIGADADTSWLLEQTESYFASWYTRNDSYTISASNMESMLDTMTEMLDTVKLAIAAIASISLLVGGIGVMNIMLVSITERTREIGTRKALGATNGAIRLQFITESVVICLVGGALGIALGVAGGGAAATALGYPARPSLPVMLLAAGFSVAIGVFFGYYPANKAARLDPIQALRYE